MVIVVALLGISLSGFARVEAGEQMVGRPVGMAQAGPTATPTATASGDNVTAAPTMEPILQDRLEIITGNVQRPNGILWYEGFLYLSCSGDFTVYQVNDRTGETFTYIAGVQNTHTLYVEPQTTPGSGITIWVADFQRNALSYIQTTPRRLETIRDGLASPWGLAAAADGSFYLTQFGTDDVINVARDGTTIQVATGFRNPTGLVVDGEYLYVANNGSARRAIEWFEIPPAGTVVTEQDVKPLVSGLQNATNVILGPDGWLYFAYSLGTRGIVGRVDADVCRENGGCTNADVEIVLWSELAAPLAGLTITPDMRLFVHTMFGAEIYWVQLPENPRRKS
jgi:hypothetical protein